MKLINYYLVLVFSILFLSCDDDDNSTQTLSQNDIQGEWFLSELNASQPVDLNNDGISTINLTQETDCFDEMTINFENDTYEFTYPKIEFTGENDQSLVCNNALNVGTYILENGELTATTMIDGSTSTESVMIELNNNQLKFTITSTQVNEYLDLSTTDNENADLEFLEFIFVK
ncbi:DUF5004 domain-containing protein [Psychroflexus tropicus]|uniref:DUF5004 domain-containing protein n=1 Tax=Psychroflexus tropicus TaxID=197345 RepID=UPI00035CEB2B|nr:lipocalin family protein [Psychroflexus tropicus]